MYSHLKDMLIDKALESLDFAHTLQWHLTLERQNDDNKPMTKTLYQNVWDELMREMSQQAPELHEGTLQGIDLMNRMNNLTSKIKSEPEFDTIDKRKDALRKVVAHTQSEFYLMDLGKAEGLQSPLVPQYRYFGV